MVRILLEPNVCVSCCHRADSNWAPRSMVTTEEVPNLEIHPSMNACATVGAVLSGMGMASGHLVKRSIHVSM